MVNARTTPRPRLAAALSLCLALPACVAAEDDAGPVERLGAAAHAVTVAEAANTSCSTTSVKGLSEQIVAQSNCISPGAFTQVPALGNLSLGAAVFPYLEEPARDALVAALESAPGTTMTVNSMLRTVAQQYLLYRWYQNGQCGIGLAATPGSSNHETGLALDVQSYTTWRPTLEDHGFAWFGSSDAVHFDYVGPGAVDHRGTDVLAFQQLWNLNHPEDPIGEDGDYGPQTEARLQAAPADGFPIGADCGAATPGPDVHPSIGMPAGMDRFDDGGSAGVIDLFEGEAYEVRLEITNKGGDPASNVDVGIWLEAPYLSAIDYLIESDFEQTGVFVESDANTAPENPPHGAALEPELSLRMYALSPGETKRITLTVRADRYSIGVADAPDVRFWVKDVPDHYHQDEWGGPATNVDGSQTFGERLEVVLQTDVYSRSRWEWDADRLEGWAAEGAAAIAPDPAAGALVVDSSGADGAIVGPETAFPAGASEAVRIRAKRRGGEGPARLYFMTAAAPEVSEDRAIAFELPDDEAFHEIAIDVGSHPEWAGTITGLRLAPLGTGAGTAEIDSLRAIEPPGGSGAAASGDGEDAAAACTCAAPGRTGMAPRGLAVAAIAAVLLCALRRSGR